MRLCNLSPYSCELTEQCKDMDRHNLPVQGRNSSNVDLFSATVLNISTVAELEMKEQESSWG